MSYIPVDKDGLLEILKEYSLDNNPLILSAIDKSLATHGEELRDDGSSVMEQHIFPMVVRVVENYADREDIEVMIISTLLHDIIEDSGCTYSEIKTAFGKDVADIVLSLTKKLSEEVSATISRDAIVKTRPYVERLMRSTEAAQIIKLEDRLNNLLSTREITVSRKPYKAHRYIEETRELYFPLVKKVVSTHLDYKALFEEQFCIIQDLLKDSGFSPKQYVN